MTSPRPPSGPSPLGRDAGSADQPAGSGTDVSEQSVGELLAELSRDVSTLMRQEVELAKAEVKAEVAQAGKGAGMLGGAGFAGYMLLLFLSFAAWWGLANVMDTGVAALIVAVVWGVIAAVLAVLGRSTLKRLHPKPERTIDTAKQIPTAFKGG